MFSLPFFTDKQRAFLKQMHPLYEITPQMRDYHVLTKFLELWLPQVMSCHMPCYQSDSMHTDPFGFRRTVNRDQQPISTTALDSNSSWNILLGGSTACGVGSSSDHTTIPSYLNRESENLWLNWGVIRHNINQSLALFLAHHHLVPKIDQVVLLMGANEAAQYILAEQYPRFYGSFANWNRYFYGMNGVHPDDKVEDGKIQKGDVLVDIFDHEEQLGLVTEMMQIALTNWKHITQARSAELAFLFQPSPIWMKRKLAPEEEQLFSILDNMPGNTYRNTWSKMVRIGHQLITETEKICKELEIPFINTNQLLDERGLDGKWLFADRSHFTDLGAEILSEILTDNTFRT